MRTVSHTHHEIGILPNNTQRETLSQVSDKCRHTWLCSPGMLASPSSPRKHVLNRFTRVLRGPDTVLASTAPFVSTGILASSPRRFAHNHFQVALLRTEPVFDEICWVTAETLEEGMFGFRIRNRLDHNGKLIVQALGLREHAQVLGILQELSQACLDGVANRNEYVVHCRLGIFVEFLVNAHGIHEFDWRQRPKVAGDVVLQIWDMALVNADDLWMLVVSITLLVKNK